MTGDAPSASTAAQDARHQAYERYLGAAVIASFDGYHIILRTDDGNNQRIALAPEVFEALLQYQEWIDDQFKIKGDDK